MHGSRANTATTIFALVVQLLNFYLPGILMRSGLCVLTGCIFFLRYIDSVDNGELGKDWEM